MSGTAEGAQIGFVLQGTITERSITAEDIKNPKKQKVYGPYYQWTWKERGKTVTFNLSKSQIKIYQRAINDNRKMENIISEMRTLSFEILEATTEGVKKRKPGRK